MRFKRIGGGLVELAATAIAAMQNHRQLDPGAAEAGGVLLGRLIRDSMDVVVDRVSLPSPSDKRSRFRFFRAAKPAQGVVDAAWRASSGTSIYLGEWHTHAEGDPGPSTTDRRDWRRIMKWARFEQDALFFVIVGTSRIGVWELRRLDSSARQLDAMP
ncbi:MAG: Mov34/MPN/PAD-1 family protein [Planctomycetota bacterium]